MSRNEMSITMTQKQILTTLIQGVDGTVWASSRIGWSLDEQPPTPVCDWRGISCEDGQTITGIHLGEQDFIGTLPAALGQLTSLRTLVLKQNMFHGTIPVAIAQLPNLEVVDFSENRLSGHIPKFTSSNMRKILLADNQFGGTLPTDFGVGLTKLKELDVIRNALIGELPQSLGLMTNLNKLSLSENKFYGLIPENLGFLMNLEFLYVDMNHLVGTIPRSLTPPNSPLKEVWFQGNQFSGTVPAAFAEMKNLLNLYVDGNKFTGQLPSDLCKPEINADFFADVEDDGSLAERDYCASIACPSGTVSIEGVWPCRTCDAGTYGPYLGQEVECLQRDEGAIIHELWKATNGEQWNTNNNWYYDGVEICDFTGITCNGEHQILSISLPNFNLRGTIPEALGFLEHLQKLDLSGNELYGFIPSDLRFAPLDSLDLSGNHLMGIVPPMLCQAGVVNGNGVNGAYSCDHIVCPVGTYSSSGRALYKEQCQPCGDGVEYLGRTSCSGFTAQKAGGMSTGGKVGLSFLLIGLAATFGVFGYIFLRKKRRMGVRHLDEMKEFNVTDHLDVEGTMPRKMPPPSDPLYMGTFPDSVEVEEMHDDDMSSITRVRKKKGKKRKSSKKSTSARYNQVIAEEEQDSESVSSNPVWLDVPKLESPRSLTPPSIT